MTEVLIIDAELDSSGKFTMRYAYTTPELKHPQVPQASDDEPLMAIVIGQGGRQLTSARLRRFQPPEPDPGPPVWDVRGAVALGAGAESVEILDGERHITRIELDPQPEIRIEVARLSKGSDGAMATLEFTPTTTRGAWMAVTILTDDQPPRSIYLGRPMSELEVDLGLSIGSEARIGVLYSTGTRAAGAVSDPVKLPRRQLPLIISSPRSDSTISQWDPIDCIAGFSVPMAHMAEHLDGVLWSVDGEEAGEGRLVTVGPLSVGKHEITARVSERENDRGGSASVVVTVGGEKRYQTDS